MIELVLSIWGAPVLGIPVAGAALRLVPPFHD